MRFAQRLLCALQTAKLKFDRAAVCLWREYCDESHAKEVFPSLIRLTAAENLAPKMGRIEAEALIDTCVQHFAGPATKGL